MNETRKILNKFEKGREDLGKKEGAKDRVEQWTKNLKQLTGDQKKANDILQGMGEEGSTGEGKSSY